MSTPPGNKTPLQRRRMTSPADMTRSSLSLPPESSKPPANIRPPSPLRNTYVPNTSTGIYPADVDSDDDDADSDIDQDDQQKRNENHPYQSSSPASSVSQLAASFAQRVGTFVAATRSLSGSSHNHLPTDAELEAEAHKERERSRREAELILTREAEERRMAEEKILAMRERGESLPPPPSRMQTMSNPPSPSGSPKPKDNTSWWSAAKNRLTPTKEKDPLTPAQQVILEAKARERENQQKIKGTDAMLNLNIPHGPPSRPVPTSPVSPTPSRNQAPNLTPSPMRSNTDGAPSPSREAPPLYAQFTPQGTLDVHGTLLTIVKRFEKLEKWTVGHVRALEDRMNDVERWLVEKEVEKEDKGVKDGAVSSGPPQDNKPQQNNSSSSPAATADQNVTRELTDMREELNELQDRVGELGREMARMSTPSRHPSSSSPPLSLSASLPGSVFATTTTPHTPPRTRLPSTTARESTSPPIAASSKHTGTRFPYPTGDYASPPDNLFSPPHSPPGSLNTATWTRSAAAANNSTNSNANTNTDTSANTTSPNTGANATTMSAGLFTSSSTSASRPLPTSPKSTPSASASASASFTRVASPPPLVSSHSHQPSSSSLNSLNSLSLLPPPKIPASSSASSSPSGSPSGSGRSKKTGKMRQSSVSPTPRKRYTVALGEPIVSREPQQVQESVTPVPKKTHSRNQSLVSTASFLSDSDTKSENNGENGTVSGGGEEDREEDEDEFQDETIGKRASSRILTGAAAANGSTTNNNNYSSKDAPPSPSPILSRRSRVRPQSTYDFSSFLKQHQQPQLQARTSQQSLQSNQSHHSSHSLHLQGSSGPTPVAPLAIKSRWRSQSTDRGSSSSSLGDRGDPVTVNTASAGGPKFVDPLALRKQEKGEKVLPMPKKRPVGELVAFFDGDKRV